MTTPTEGYSEEAVERAKVKISGMLYDALWEQRMWGVVDKDGKRTKPPITPQAKSQRLAAEILSTLPPLPAVGWRDIATAPKDGTPIDIWVKGYPSRRIVNMKWDEHDWGFRNHSDPEQGWMEDEEITHYMPIPTPPTAQGGEES